MRLQKRATRIAALPKDPNPQDSYAEILRMAGRFDQAIEHYRAALAIDPDFYSSQFGIADTYSLMGDQVRARQEYAIGFKKFSPLELDRIQWQTREAITFVREGDYAAANRALQAVAEHAHAKHLSQSEADAWRQMAMYQRRPQQAIALLAKAQAAVQQGKNAMAAAIQPRLRHGRAGSWPIPVLLSQMGHKCTCSFYDGAVSISDKRVFRGGRCFRVQRRKILDSGDYLPGCALRSHRNHRRSLWPPLHPCSTPSGPILGLVAAVRGGHHQLGHGRNCAQQEACGRDNCLKGVRLGYNTSRPHQLGSSLIAW